MKLQVAFADGKEGFDIDVEPSTSFEGLIKEISAKFSDIGEYHVIYNEMKLDEKPATDKIHDWNIEKDAVLHLTKK